MKYIIPLILTLLFTSQANAKTNLGTRELILDNGKVEVSKLTYPAGTESGMHTHKYAHRVVYVIKGGTLELVSGDKSKPSKVVKLSEGKAIFAPGTTHNVRNIGNTEIILLETEIK